MKEKKVKEYLKNNIYYPKSKYWGPYARSKSFKFSSRWAWARFPSISWGALSDRFG